MKRVVVSAELAAAAPAPATAERLLDAAESLFAAQGFAGSTLRQITTAAGANLAAVHYHFGDKEALLVALLTRRIRPLNTERLGALAQAEARTGGQPVPLRELLDILFRPLFRLGTEPAGGDAFVRLLGRIFTEPLPFLGPWFKTELEPLIAAFGAALRRSVPGLSLPEFRWRLSFTIGALHHTLSNLHGSGPLARGLTGSDDPEGALQRLLDFTLAGLSAPVSPSTPKR